MNRARATIAATHAQPAPSGRSPQARPEVGNQGLLRLLTGARLTAKPAVSAPGDADERAADALAERVLAGERPTPLPTPATTRSAAADALGGGRGLDAASRAFFEPRFGVDLGGVRVHDDAVGNQASRSLGARAFAVDGHVAFAAGEHHPESPDGRRLLAHELAHVVQPPAARIARQVGSEVAGAGPVVAEADAEAIRTGPTAPDSAAAVCATVEEQARRDAFAARTDLHLDRYVPATNLGMFDTAYLPATGLMPVLVKIAFTFVDVDRAEMTPEYLARTPASQLRWTARERTAFVRDFIAQQTTTWSGRYLMRSTKPCWDFTALPVVSVAEAASAADAHYSIAVHKRLDPGERFQSGVEVPDREHPEAAPVGDFAQSDVSERADVDSAEVAAVERQRVETAIATTAATPIRFARDSDAIDPASEARLLAFAAACRDRNPSAPAVPILLYGFASDQAEEARDPDLAMRRAQAVAAVLAGARAPQPLLVFGWGYDVIAAAPGGRVDLAVDTAFEVGYRGNRYAVGPHEFGHMIGLPDEYLDNTSGALGTVQENFVELTTSAGVAGPTTWGVATSSVMSVGVDILPRHYLTFWEALGRMTRPDIAPDEWSLR